MGCIGQRMCCDLCAHVLFVCLFVFLDGISNRKAHRWIKDLGADLVVLC